MTPQQRRRSDQTSAARRGWHLSPILPTHRERPTRVLAPFRGGEVRGIDAFQRHRFGGLLWLWTIASVVNDPEPNRLQFSFPRESERVRALRHAPARDDTRSSASAPSSRVLFVTNKRPAWSALKACSPFFGVSRERRRERDPAANRLAPGRLNRPKVTRAHSRRRARLHHGARSRCAVARARYVSTSARRQRTPELSRIGGLSTTGSAGGRVPWVSVRTRTATEFAPHRASKRWWAALIVLKVVGRPGRA
jgi:hypothetical protein